MRNPSEWYLRRRMGFVAVFLIAIGTWVAIMFFLAPLLCLLLFVFIAGPGIFIGHKQKNLFWIALSGLGIASCGYLFGGMLLGPVDTHGALVNDFFSRVLPVICLGTLPLAWFSAKPDRKRTPSRFSGFMSTLIAYLISLVVIAPFVLAGMFDYNHRADTSLPEVISMEVVGRGYDSDLGNCLDVEAPAKGLSFLLWHVPYDFYNQHDVGSMIDVRVRKGALGYPWVEGYG